MIADHAEARQAPARDGEVPYRPLPPGRLYLDQAGWDAMLAKGPVMLFSPYGRADGAEGIDGHRQHRVKPRASRDRQLSDDDIDASCQRAMDRTDADVVEQRFDRHDRILIVGRQPD